MMSITRNGFGRRRFLANTSALGAASLLGLPRTAASEPPLETRRIRLVHDPAICLAPQYLAEDLLRLEGFSEVEYRLAVSQRAEERAEGVTQRGAR
jgi:NitT/TauT family transport system substrate-binding protein